MEHYHVERNHQGIGNRLINDHRGKINMTGGNDMDTFLSSYKAFNKFFYENYDGVVKVY